MQKLPTFFFFSKNISIYAIFNDQSFNDTLTNDIVSFEQPGPGDQTNSKLGLSSVSHIHLRKTRNRLSEQKGSETVN